MSQMKLAVWQQLEKSRQDLLYNCSEYHKLNDEWVPFSIGMGWKILEYTGVLKDTQIGSHEKLVFCGVTLTTDQRRRGTTSCCRSKFIETLKKNGIENTLLNANSYFTALPSYKFVISPEGNGVDCHRHYESLMAGCIPIVEDHKGIREKYKGCPILFTTDYSEITPEYLETKYLEMIDTLYDFSKMLLSSYSIEEQCHIRENGNAHAMRLYGQTWY
jgi:hypothetical protein